MPAESEMQDALSKTRDAVNAALGAVARDGTLPAIGREALKDLHNTLNEVFFGRGDGPAEPGAPLNPTQGEVAAGRREDLHPYGSLPTPAAAHASAGDIAHDRDVARAGQAPGREREPDQPNAGDIAHDRDRGGSKPASGIEQEHPRGPEPERGGLGR